MSILVPLLLAASIRAAPLPIAIGGGTPAPETPGAGRPPKVSLTLAQAEAAAKGHSLELRAAAEESAGAKDLADAQFAPLLPKLTLDGSYHYQTEIPSFAPGPGAPAQPFGAHRATSIGPTLSWTLWDQGSIYKAWRAQQALSRSQKATRLLVETQAVLGARLAYFQVQLAREQVWLLSDSVSLASAQYGDIVKRLNAGAASRIDSLSSHQAELSRRKDFLQAQAALGAALRQLFQLTGLGQGLDPTRAVDVRVSTAMAEGLPSPTLAVELDLLSETPAGLAEAEKIGPAAAHPSVLALDEQAQAARLASEGISAGRWPKLQFQGRLSYDYPNGPVLNSVTQKQAGLSASVPLFEGSQTSLRAQQQERAAAAAERRRDLAAEELSRDWDKARLSLAALRDQQALDETTVREAEELARLVYTSYKAGRSTFLEVQTYNLSALQAKVDAARTRAQILIQLATLAQLAAKG